MSSGQRFTLGNPSPSLRRSLVCSSLGLALALTQPPAAAATSTKHADTHATPLDRLHQLFDAEWERNLREDPLSASANGDHRYDTLWPDPSPAEQLRERDETADALRRLNAIPLAGLAPSDRLDADLFRDLLEDRLKSAEFHEYLRPMDHIYGLQSAQNIVETLRFESADDYRHWIARLRGFGLYTDQTIAAMRLGMAQSQVQPRTIMERIPAQLTRHIVATPSDSPFYAPFQQFPATLDADTQKELRTQAEAAIAEVVVPAYQRFQTFFNTEYLPASRTTLAATALPEGQAYYAYLIHHHTTTKLSAAQVHQLGLDEVKRIHGNMEAIIKSTGFTGSFDEFSTFLRTDPRFYYHSGEELQTGYAAIAKHIDGELPKLFHILPRLPYGVHAIPDDVAPYQTTAYYQPGAADGSRAGFFYVNLYKPETRPKWEMEALTSHEAVPGHHLQIALGQELPNLPKFRKFGNGYNAFHEGWALYSESLGEQLGLYRDPYSKYGQLTFEMWRACRLVVDTGIHAMGWSRDQAIDFMMANMPRARNDVEVEVDRYIAWPGQALAYKIGQLKITELRERAKAAVGDKFDIRAFHDVVIGSGDIPLDILEQNVDRWIAGQKAN
jgi:uncharacterized protein (DUF885 family)